MVANVIEKQMKFIKQSKFRQKDTKKGANIFNLKIDSTTKKRVGHKCIKIMKPDKIY